MKRLINFWHNHKLMVLIGILGFLFVLLIILKLTRQPVEQKIPKESALPTVYQQKPFKIISTSPRNNETGIDSGEIEISFTTDNPILSQNSFSLDITPPLPYYYKLTNTYPTSTITARVYGGLKTKTIYTVSVNNSSGDFVYAWSFTTSAQEGSSSSALVEDEEKKFIQKYQPLFGKVPYEAADFSIDYTNKLTLEVVIKNRNIDKVKQEVLDWIKSQGVDPSTHTINYINGF